MTEYPFHEFAEKVLSEIKETQNIILATCADNRVTTRLVGHLLYGHTLVFSTNIDSLKVAQIKRNPNVAFYLNGYNIEAVAKLYGHPQTHPTFEKDYAEKYPESIDGIIIHGTGGKNPLLPFGKALAGITRFFSGDRYRARLVTKMAFGAYNKRFDKAEGENAWLTREGSLVADRATDPLVQFIFSSAAYSDLFKSIGLCNSGAHFKAYPKGLATLVMSGDADPVGNYGRGVIFVHKKLREKGVSDLTLKLYEGARHELFNERNREEVFADIFAWIKARI